MYLHVETVYNKRKDRQIRYKNELRTKMKCSVVDITCGYYLHGISVLCRHRREMAAYMLLNFTMTATKQYSQILLKGPYHASAFQSKLYILMITFCLWHTK